MPVVSSQQRLFPRQGDPASVDRPYVPILLAKQGERIGLGHLDAAIRDAITPYLRIVPPELRHRKADAAPPQEIARLTSVLQDQAAYLDAAGTPRRDRHAASLSAMYVRNIYETAAAADMAFMPVYPYGRPDLAETIRSFAPRSLGAAVLLQADAAMPWGRKRLRELLRDEVRSVSIEPHRLDLMIDLGYVADGADNTSSTVWLVREAAGAAPWRSLIIAATSVPDSVAREIPDGSLNGIERRELRIFREVQAAMDRQLRFGDYGVQYPVPPTPQPVPQMRASIRYTAGDFMFVSRGGRPLGAIPRDDRPAEYREIAARLSDHPPFKAGCCWGDRFIEELADDRRIVRAQSSLRAVATCHHVTVVATERSVKRFAARSATRLREPASTPTPTSR